MHRFKLCRDWFAGLRVCGAWYQLHADQGAIFMLRIPRRYSHFVFGVIQSGLTSLIAAAVASYPFLQTGHFVRNWMGSWLISWVMMMPAVLFAAPIIRALADLLTRE